MTSVADKGQDHRDLWTLTAVVFASLSLLAALLGVGLGIRALDESKGSELAAGAGTPASVMVHLSEFKIEPGEITIARGGTLEVMNAGTAAHNLAIRDADLVTPLIDGGGSASLPLAGLSAGTYRVFCSVAGHEQAGMKATLRVVDAGDGVVAAAAPATHNVSAKDMDAAMAKSVRAFPAKTAGLGAQPLAPTVLADGTKQFELTSRIVKWEVEAGRTVEGWSYNGTVPGPTLRVNPGDKVRVVLHNELPESTAIHFHGLITPNAMDGVPDITQTPVKKGDTFSYIFTAQNTAAVGMYHSHHNAVAQVPNGLAGAILVGDIPLPAGVAAAQEQIMMLNDSGTIGFSLNGKSFPATAPIVAKPGEWVKVHYMNEGQMIHPMHLHGMAQLVIAKDGFPVPQPYNADTINVGPGERYTVLVHAELSGVWAWHCHILNHAEHADGMFGMVTAMVVK